MDPHPDRPAPRRAVARFRPPWWLAGLAVFAVVAVVQTPDSLTHTIAASFAPALAGCAWVLARSGRPP